MALSYRAKVYLSHVTVNVFKLSQKFHSFLDESHCTAPSFLEGNFTLLQPSETPTDTSDIRTIGQGTPLTIIKITVKIMGIKGMNRPKRISLSFLLFSINSQSQKTASYFLICNGQSKMAKLLLTLDPLFWGKDSLFYFER